MELINDLCTQLQQMKDASPMVVPDQSTPGLPTHILLKQQGTLIIAHSTDRHYLHNKDSTYFSGLADTGIALGFRVIQIWEDLWQTKRSIIISRLNSILGNTNRIFGRSTHIKTLTQAHLDDFLYINHLQGAARGKYRYGLFYNDQLIAVASFSRSRIIPRDGIDFHSFEMIRYCSGLNLTVTGGADKLLKHFIRHVNPDDIMTYADRDWGSGLAYEKLGFETVGITPPSVFWLEPVTFKRIFPNKIINYLKAKGWEPEPGQQPENILAEKGYQRIYNAGNIKYLMKLKKHVGP